MLFAKCLDCVQCMWNPNTTALYYSAASTYIKIKIVNNPLHMYLNQRVANSMPEQALISFQHSK